MKLRIEFYSWSDYEDERGRRSSTRRQEVPLRLGVIEECGFFKILEIKEDSVVVAYQDAQMASLGTYSTPGRKQTAKFPYVKEIKVGEAGITVTSGETYNGNAHGTQSTLYLLDA